MTYEDIYKLAESRKHLAGHDYHLMDEIGRLAVEVLRLREIIDGPGEQSDFQGKPYPSADRGGPFQ